MKDLLKYALLGVGGFMLFRNLNLGAMFTTSTGTSGGGGNGGGKTMTPDGKVTKETATAALPVDKDSLLRAAGAGNQEAIAKVDANGWTLNSDQWNYYRQQGGAGVTLVDLFPAADRGYLMTAVEYHKRRKDSGLSGISFY